MEGFRNEIRKKPYLRWLLLISNWVAQGIIHADRTEKIYKILFTLSSSCILLLAFHILIGSPNLYYQILIAVFMGHTINWLVNGAIMSILIHRLYLATVTKNDIFYYLDDLSLRLKNVDSITAVAVFGSVSRGQLKNSSDLDICFIRKPGFINAIKSLIFMVKERKLANQRKIPIEPYLADSVQYMKTRYRSDEPPVNVKNESNILGQSFSQIYSIEQAKILNSINAG